jgi:cobalt-precorrin 5A hydrolase / cobalt-factor III methyltransferase / precorrin-3B C17-methyltransferase
MAVSVLPESVAIVVLGPSALETAHRIKALLPGAAIHVPAGRNVEADVGFAKATEHLAALFAAGTPIVALCASGIVVRALAPLLAAKRDEPAVVSGARHRSNDGRRCGDHHRGRSALRSGAR